MYRDGFNDLKRYYLDNFDTDVFIHTWKDVIYKGTVFSPDEKDKKQFEYTSDIFSELVDLYNPKGMLVEEQIAFVEPDIFGPVWKQSLQNCASMWYSVYKANELKNNYEDISNISYDYVIRTRTDLKFDLVINNIKAYDPTTITTYKWKTRYPQVTYGYKDCFAIGGKHSMDIYSSLYLHLADYIQQDINYKDSIKNEDHLRNEYLLKWHLDKNSIKVNEIDTFTNKIGFTFYR